MTVLGMIHLPFQLPAAPPAPTGALPPPRAAWLAALARLCPRDPLALALLAVACALLALALVLRRALPTRPHTPTSGPAGLTTPVALAFDAAQRPPSPERAPAEKAPRPAPAPAAPPRLALRSWNVLARLVELFDLLEDDEPHVQIIEKSAGPAAPPLSAPPPPPRRRSPPGHRRTQSVHGGDAPEMPLRPPPPARPLSAAKLIMSRHIVRKPYRPPPVPGASRTQPCSRLTEQAV